MTRSQKRTVDYLTAQGWDVEVSYLEPPKTCRRFRPANTAIWVSCHRNHTPGNYWNEESFWGEYGPRGGLNRGRYSPGTLLMSRSITKRTYYRLEDTSRRFNHTGTLTIKEASYKEERATLPF